QRQDNLTCHRTSNPRLRRAEHHRLRVEPSTLIEQPSEPTAVLTIYLNCVLVVDPRYETLVGGEQERHARRFIDAATLRFDDPILDLIAHPKAMPAPRTIRFIHQEHRIGKALAVKGNRKPLFECDRDLLRPDGHVLAPERHTHDR